MIDKIFDELLLWVIEKKQFYKSEVMNTHGETKKICFKIFNVCVNSIEAAKTLYGENKKVEACTNLLKAFEKAEKYAEDLTF